MAVKPKFGAAVTDLKNGTATPQFLSGGNDNPPDYDVPQDNNEWQQNLDGPWFATADVELDNDGTSIPLQLFDDDVPEGNETIKWTISDSVPFGFNKTKYTFTEGDTTVDIPLSDDKKSKKNKTITIEIEDNDTVTEDADVDTADTVDNDTVSEDAGVDTADTLDNDTVSEDAGVDTADTLDNDPLTENAGVDTGDNDPLTGGAGGIDTTTDFTGQEGDELLISARGFGGGLTEGDLLAQQVPIGSAAANASEPFIYDSSTEGPFFDVDNGGSFGQTQIASLPIGLS